ncbi:MAG: tetratricopeptide repeat protein [Dissulfuribacterales bacterium]
MDSKIDSVVKLNRKAGDHSAQGDDKKAVQSYIKALNLLSEAESLEEQEIKARLLNNIGHVQVKIGDLDQAIVSFNKSAALYLGLDDMLGVGQQLGNVGSVYRDKGMWGAARKSYDKSLAAFKLQGDKSGLADQYSDIGYICAQEKEFASALEWFYMAKALYEELNLEERARLVEKNISILSNSHE